MSKSNVLTRLSSIFSTRIPNKSSIKPTSPIPDPNTLKPTPTLPDPNPNTTKIRNPKPNTPYKIIIPTTLPDSFIRKTLSQKIKDLLNETNPQLLAEKFKYLSNFSHFRENCSGIYDLTINRLTIAKQYPLIESTLDSQKPFLSKESFAGRIIFLYGKYGMFDHAYKVFDELPERKCTQSVKVFNTLLGAASNSGKYDQVYEMFYSLPTKLCIEVDVDSYNAVMHALCKTGEVEKAELLLGEMEECGLKPDVVSFNTLLCVLYEAGDCQKGDNLWDRMLKANVVPDITSWNFKLQGLVKKDMVVEAVQLATELTSKSKGLKPDVFTYNVVIQGLINRDDLGCVKEWYGKLIKNRCIPNKTTFSTLVPFLCEKRDFGLAFEVCEYMLTKRRNCLIDEGVLQNVVDGLAENAMVDKAKVLVGLGISNSYAPYHLVMPDAVK